MSYGHHKRLFFAALTGCRPCTCLTFGAGSERPKPSGPRYVCIHPAATCADIITQMSLRALLMPLFLIVALLVNGPGIAGASVQMGPLPDSTSAVAPTTVARAMAEAKAACRGAAPIASTHDQHPLVADQAAAGSQPGECGEEGDCCTCMHHCSAAIAGPVLLDSPVRYRQTAEPFLSLHAFAAPTNLFRPPIG